MAENVLSALSEIPLVECNVVEVKGYGRQKSYLDQYSESEYSPAFLPKVELNLFVNDEHAESAVQKILQAAPLGPNGRRQSVRDCHCTRNENDRILELSKRLSLILRRLVFQE